MKANKEYSEKSELSPKSLKFEAKQNLLGFFDLLLKIDKRINPHLYKKVKNNENNRGSNHTNKAK